MDTLMIESTLKIIVVLVGIMIIAMGFILVIKNLGRQERGCTIIPGCISMMTGMIFILASLFMPFDDIANEFKATSEAMAADESTDEIYTEAVNNGYTVYVDGTEVKPDTINVSDYKMTVDDENHNVLLSTSDGDNRRRLILLLATLMPMMLSFTLFKK